MTMMNVLKKTVATGMMALTFLAPMGNAALAAPKGGAPKPHTTITHRAPAPVHKMAKHSPAPKHHVSRPAPAPRYHAPAHHHSSHHHDDTAAAVIGSLILGTIISAAVANAE